MIPLGQRDPRWGNISLGYSNTKIKDFGCTITCIAMIAGTTPDVVNTKLKAVGGFANGNLVIWSKIPVAFPSLTFVARAYTYNNDVVKNNLPCLVEVDFDNSPNSFGNHWVVFIGNQKLLDPWTGTTRPTGSYKYLKGYAIVKKKELVEQTPAITEPTTETPSQPETTPEPLPETNTGTNGGETPTTVLPNVDGSIGHSGVGDSPVTSGQPSDSDLVVIPPDDLLVSYNPPTNGQKNPFKAFIDAIVNFLKQILK